MNIKHCRKCGQDKPHDQFYKSRHVRSGLAPHCIACTKIQTRAWALANNDKTREYALNYRGRRSIEETVWINARDRARKLNVAFNLTEEDIVIPDACPVLGIPLRRNHRQGAGHDDSISLDRFIPDLGYIKGNVYVISNRANKMKSNATADEIEKLLKWMRQQESATVAN